MFDDYDFGDFDFVGGASGGDISVGDGGGVIVDGGGIFDGGVFDVLGRIGGAVGTVAKSVAEFQATRDAQQIARQDQAFNRELQLMGYDLQKTKLQGDINVAREQSQLQAAIERAKLAAASGLNGFYNAIGAPAQSVGGVPGVLMLAAAGLGLYWLLKK